MSFIIRRQAPRAHVFPLALLLVLALVASLAPPWAVRGEEIPPDHLVISELVTGGASASDELIEVYNPTPAALPLEGLELVYVSASGATVSRRVAWAAGAPDVPAGHHVLAANELGVYAAIADATFATGMASTGGSVALRIQGAESAIDSLAWGTATSSWREGGVAVPPPAGSSLERLPGGADGSTRDTDDNAADFALRDAPGPQNLASAPTPDPDPTPRLSTSPMASVEPSPSTTASSTPSADPTPSSSAPGGSPGAPAPVTVAEARALADGAVATLDVTATSNAEFTEGGGYVADATGGIAVIVDGGAFDRGERLAITGTLGDRFAQRTLRVGADAIVRLGNGAEPAAAEAATGSIGEVHEGRLVRVTGAVAGAPTALSSGLAYDVDDGSGPVRVLVATSTGIDTGAWSPGATVKVVGIVGQRDSSGTGALGYRLQPRDAADVESVAPGTSTAPTATAAPSEGPSPGGSASPAPDGVVSIAEARRAPKNARVRVRGIVTLPTGIVDGQTAVVQDGSGAIVLRVAEEVGHLAGGSVLQVDGTRSTKSGMETLRVTVVPERVGSATDPAARPVPTGAVGETHEALLVSVRGGLTGAARTSSTGTVTFQVDDGSGPIRVAVGSAIGYDDTPLAAGTWVEVRGVVGQETTGAQPSRGYRIWPRADSDIAVLAAPVRDGTGNGQGDGSGAGGGGEPLADLGGVTDDPVASGLRIGATVVAGPWPELRMGALLWDGTEVVALDEAASARVSSVLGAAAPPVPVELTGVRRAGTRLAGVPVARVQDGAEGLVRGAGPTHPPATALPRASDPPRWVAMVGRLVGAGDRLRLVTASRASVHVEMACDGTAQRPTGMVGVTGLATADRPGTVVVGCVGLMPASALERGNATSHAAATSDEVDGAAQLPAATDRAEERRPLAAALVAAAAMVLVAGAVVARRAADEPPPQDEADDDADGGVAHAPPAVTSPPSLTLVALPRERGP